MSEVHVPEETEETSAASDDARAIGIPDEEEATPLQFELRPSPKGGRVDVILHDDDGARWIERGPFLFEVPHLVTTIVRKGASDDDKGAALLEAMAAVFPKTYEIVRWDDASHAAFSTAWSEISQKKAEAKHAEAKAKQSR